MKRTKQQGFLTGFTLAELLIALAILGVIATFTIPKVLQSQQDTKFKSIAKEVAGTITAAYAAAQKDGIVTSSTRSRDLTPYLNYVKYDTSSTIDLNHGIAGSNTCTGDPCVILHNGAKLMLYAGSFNNTAITNAIYFVLDPDAVTNTAANAPGKSLMFILYYNGRLATRGQHPNNTCNSVGCLAAPVPTEDPPWFSWD